MQQRVPRAKNDHDETAPITMSCSTPVILTHLLA